VDYLLPLAGIALAHQLAAMSPGPSFVLVTRASAALSRRHGLAAALGAKLVLDRT
jgi:threonine/homoserine/homoserine lactone efflux protein